MKIEVLADADSVAQAAAAIIATEARAAFSARGRCIVAVSGGHTPCQMFRVLAGEEVPWEGLHVVQVDERIAPSGHPDRNLTLLREALLKYVPLREEQIHTMPVESPDLSVAATRYGQELSENCSIRWMPTGVPPTICRSANLSPRQPALKRPLMLADVKHMLLGHWGTTPGQNFIYVHLNRVIKQYDLDMIYVSGPGHGGPAVVGNTYLEGTYSEIYPEHQPGRGRSSEALQAVLLSRRYPQPRLAGMPRLHS
jgi:hypothetical protein